MEAGSCGGSKQPWLQAVALARRRSRSQPVEAPGDEPAHDRNGQLDESSQQLLAAVTQLPRHERRVLMLKHFDGHSVRTIAEMTGRPVGTVTKQLSRAYQRLREQLREVGP